MKKQCCDVDYCRQDGGNIEMMEDNKGDVGGWLLTGC